MSAADIEKWVNEDTEGLLNELKTKYAFVSFDEIQKCKEKKLHHELTLEIEKFVKLKNVDIKDKFRLFFTFLSPLIKKVKKTTYAELLHIVTTTMDPSWTIAYVRESEVNLENDKGAIIIYRCILILKYIQLEDFKSCEKEIEETKKILRRSSELEVLNKSEIFVKYALLYLAYTPLDTIDETEKVEIGKYICIHSIISEDVYNIGEIMELPLITECVQNNPETKWLYELIVVCNEGKMDYFRETVQKYDKEIKSTLLKDYQISMLKKVTLLALMDLAFKKKKQRSDILFTEIAEHCKISVDEVERVLITARNKKIISCKIDEIEKAVKITWVKPRVLSQDKIFYMKESIDKWIAHSKSLLSYMEDLSVELLVS